TIAEALERLSNEAIEAVQNGKTLLILDDGKSHRKDYFWIDPLLIISKIDQALVAKKLRRDCSLLLRSGAIRSLHDIILAYGLGANLISPYLLFATVASDTLTP